MKIWHNVKWKDMVMQLVYFECPIERARCTLIKKLQVCKSCTVHSVYFNVFSLSFILRLRKSNEHNSRWQCICGWYMYNPKLSINNEVFLNTKTCSFLLFGHRICSVRICECFSRTKRIILFSTNFSSFLPIRGVYKKYNTLHTFQL